MIKLLTDQLLFWCMSHTKSILAPTLDSLVFQMVYTNLKKITQNTFISFHFISLKQTDCVNCFLFHWCSQFRKTLLFAQVHFFDWLSLEIVFHQLTNCYCFSLKCGHENRQRTRDWEIWMHNHSSSSLCWSLQQQNFSCSFFVHVQLSRPPLSSSRNSHSYWSKQSVDNYTFHSMSLYSNIVWFWTVLALVLFDKKFLWIWLFQIWSFSWRSWTTNNIFWHKSGFDNINDPLFISHSFCLLSKSFINFNLFVHSLGYCVYCWMGWTRSHLDSQ